MVGNLYIRGASGQNTNVGVTTFTSNIVVQANPAEVRIQHAGNSSYSRLISDNQNALNIYTGGGPSLAVKIGTEGNLALGGSNTSAYANQSHFFIGGMGNLYADTPAGSGSSLSLSNNAYINTSGNWVYRASGKATNIYHYAGEVGFRIAGSGTAGNTISWSTAALLHDDANFELNRYNGNAGQGRLTFGSSGPAFIEGYDSGNAGSGAYLRMSVNGTEKVRIPRDTWGLLVTNQGSTGNTGGYQTDGASLRYSGDSTFVYSGGAAVTFTRKTNAGKVIDFYSGTTYAGGIYVNGSNNTALQQGSDYRLKTDITSMTDGIDKVKQLNPIYYKANSGFDTTTVQNGFLAHEVQSVLPTLVDGEKDAPIDEKGKGYQTLNYAGFTPTAIAAIKELIAKVETLEAKVATLEGS